MNLQLAVVPNRLGIAVLGRRPFSEEAPGIITVIWVGRTQRWSRRGRCSVSGIVSPRKRVKAVIHIELIGKSEQTIIMNKGYQSYLMRRGRWFIGMSSAEISSIARLPRLPSSAMRNEWIYRKEEWNRCKVLADGRKRRNSCRWRGVWSRSPRLVFENMKRRGGRLGARKRQLQINGRRNATPQMLKIIRHHITEDRRSKDTHDRSCVFRLK